MFGNFFLRLWPSILFRGLTFFSLSMTNRIGWFAQERNCHQLYAKRIKFLNQLFNIDDLELCCLQSAVFNVMAWIENKRCFCWYSWKNLGCVDGRSFILAYSFQMPISKLAKCYFDENALLLFFLVYVACHLIINNCSVIKCKMNTNRKKNVWDFWTSASINWLSRNV